jgi:alpha-tubulin suppressor-like RCC1 family protein
VWAWGSSVCGQRGEGANTVSLTPTQVKVPDPTGFLTGVQTIDAGDMTNFALKNDGTVVIS